MTSTLIKDNRSKKNSKEQLQNVMNSNIKPPSNPLYPQPITSYGNKLKIERETNLPRQQPQSKTVKFQQSYSYNISSERGSYQGRNKSKQILSKVQSVLLQTQRQKPFQRLNTDELIPSFRQKYEIYQLLQEISQHKQTIDLKDKQIFYLSNQIVSLKDEYAQKTLQLQQIISENKKQLTQLRYTKLKSKRQQNQRNERILDEYKKNTELQNRITKETNQQLIAKINEQHNKNIQNIEQKFKSILKLQKRQKSNMEELFKQKANNYEEIIKNLQDEISKLRKENEQQSGENNKYIGELDGLKEQFKIFGEKASNQEKQLKIQIENLKAQILILEQSSTALKKDLKTNRIESEREIEQLEKTLEIQTEELRKLKSLLIGKDKEISKLIDEINRNSLERIRKGEQNYLDPVRACNHEGLINQLQRNISLSNKENQQLRDQLKQWGKYIGFDRSCSDRTLDLLNASSQALYAQQSFSNTLRKKLGKI